MNKVSIAGIKYTYKYNEGTVFSYGGSYWKITGKPAKVIFEEPMYPIIKSSEYGREYKKRAGALVDAVDNETDGVKINIGT